MHDQLNEERARNQELQSRLDENDGMDAQATNYKDLLLETQEKLHEESQKVTLLELVKQTMSTELKEAKEDKARTDRRCKGLQEQLSKLEIELENVRHGMADENHDLAEFDQMESTPTSGDANHQALKQKHEELAQQAAELQKQEAEKALELKNFGTKIEFLEARIQQLTEMNEQQKKLIVGYQDKEQIEQEKTISDKISTKKRIASLEAEVQKMEEVVNSRHDYDNLKAEIE